MVVEEVSTTDLIELLARSDFALRSWGAPDELHAVPAGDVVDRVAGADLDRKALGVRVSRSWTARQRAAVRPLADGGRGDVVVEELSEDREHDGERGVGARRWRMNLQAYLPRGWQRSAEPSGPRRVHPVGVGGRELPDEGTQRGARVPRVIASAIEVSVLARLADRFGELSARVFRYPDVPEVRTDGGGRPELGSRLLDGPGRGQLADSSEGQPSGLKTSLHGVLVPRVRRRGGQRRGQGVRRLSGGYGLVSGSRRLGPLFARQRGGVALGGAARWGPSRLQRWRGGYHFRVCGISD